MNRSSRALALGGESVVRPRHRMRACFALCAVAFGLLASGCEGSKQLFTVPNSGIIGRVVLMGNLRDAAGSPTGTRTVADPSGVPVLLRRSGVVVDSSATDLGGYMFTDFAAGTYDVAATVGGTPGDSTGSFTIGDVVVSKVVRPDTIVLRDSDNFSSRPNPMSASCTITFTTLVSRAATLKIVDVGGATVRAMFSGLLAAGTFSSVWDGRDDGGQTVPAGKYWAVFRSGGDFRFCLIFKE